MTTKARNELTNLDAWPGTKVETFIQLHDKIHRLYCYIAFGFHSNPECSLSLFVKYLGLLNINGPKT